MGRKEGGAAVPLSRRAGTPSNTVWPGPRSTFVPSGHNRHGPKIGWGGCALFSVGSWVPIEHKVAWAEAYLHIPSGILVHPAVWPQRTLAENRGLCPLEEELGPHLTQCRVD